MRTLTFDDIDKEGLLLYKYKRGSLAQGTFIEGKSDIDTCSVYLAPPDQLLGLGFDYQDEVSDEKHDNVAWEFNKFMRLLLKSNPTVLEALFVDDEFVDYEHPIITELKKSRDKFVTKACFNSFGAYAVSQIKKARALGKKCLNDNGKEVERRTALSFCYTYYNQGSTKIENWLSYRGLRTEFCGLNKIPNMHDDYGVFYDWGAHFEAVGYQAIDAVRYFKEKNREYASGEKYRDDEKYCLGRYLTEEYKYSYTSIDHSQLNKKPIGYRGIFKNDDSTEVRLSSIDDKNDKPICHMSFNQNGFVKHCKDYKDYKDWVKNRNPIRYAQNKEKNYDCYLDEETEFLTSNGWKKYSDIDDKDLLGCFNGNHCLEYKPWLNRFDDIYSGDIYTFESVYTRFSVTPNHKLYLSPCHRTPTTNYNTKYDPERSDWKLLSVKDFFNGKRSHFHQLTNLHNNKQDHDDYDDDFIKILGMFLSEGSYIRRKSGDKIGISISQTNEGKGCKIMDEIKTYKIKRYVYNYEKRKKGNEYNYVCNDKTVIEKCLQCNGEYALDKDIPKYVYNFSKRQFDILLNSMMAGDGHYHKKGHMIYYTKSKRMAETLYTLCVINGYNTQLYGGDEGYKYEYERKKRKDGKLFGMYQIFISKNTEQCIALNKQASTKRKGKCGWSIKNVKNKKIVCFETEYGTLVTRNNKKIAFHGNSKNLSHSFRLMNMCIEIAENNGFNVNRRNIDRDFLLDVKMHKYDYDEIIELLEEKKVEMDDAIAKSTLPDEIDVEFVNDFVIKIRKQQLGII